MGSLGWNSLFITNVATSQTTVRLKIIMTATISAALSDRYADVDHAPIFARRMYQMTDGVLGGQHIGSISSLYIFKPFVKRGQ